MFSISQIRAHARQTIEQTPGIYLLGLAPALVSLFSSLISFFRNSSSSTVNQEALNSLTSGHFEDSLASTTSFTSTISASLFPLLIGILLSFILLSLTFTILNILRKHQEGTGFKDGFTIFQHQHFGKIFFTVFIKRLLLFLWGLIYLIGLVMIIGGLVGLIVCALLSMNSAYDPETIQYMLGMFTGILIIGLCIFAFGLAIYLPQELAYSQVEILLFEQLEAGTYTGPMALIKESRRIMKGYKFKLLLLSLSFIGWFFLQGLSFGLVGIYVYPYYSAAKIHFYNAVLKDRKMKEDVLSGNFTTTA
ncbi:DUF975 family protein [Streptococcus sp. 20-1249]|uniref:DUF975 family protein n=1 Tax=Streptococcus hepaticus TaxID=3349163 RepID=UPI003749FEBA